MGLPSLTMTLHDASEPLRKRAPTVDEHGKPVTDFMMIVPGLRRKPPLLVNQTMKDIHCALSRFDHAVVFAEFNTRLNLLWVSVKPIRGVRQEISDAIRFSVPSARLVSHI